MKPSFVASAWYGADIRFAEPSFCGTRPVSQNSVDSQTANASADSNNDVSTCCPTPVRRLEIQAARIPMAQNSPEPRSATGIPLLTGRPSASPVMLMTPLIACAMRSYPGRSAYGPVCPKPEMLAYTSEGLSADNVS